MSNRKLDLIKGTVLLIFSLLVCYESTRLPLGGFKKPGPGFFPLFLGIILGLLSLVFMIMRGWKQSEIPFSLWANRENRNRILVAIGGLIGYAILLPFMGYLISTFSLMLFLLGLIYTRKRIFVAAVSFLVTFVFYILFQVLLKIQLPYGIFKL